MFCTRCGNKLLEKDKACPYCHYSENIDSNDSTSYESNKIIVNNTVKTNSYFFNFIIYILIFSSYASIISIYLIYGFSKYFFLILPISMIIQLLAGYLLSTRIKKVLEFSKYTIILGGALTLVPIIFLVIMAILKKEIIDISIIVSIIGLYIIFLGIELYLLSNKKRIWFNLSKIKIGNKKVVTYFFIIIK